MDGSSKDVQPISIQETTFYPMLNLPYKPISSINSNQLLFNCQTQLVQSFFIYLDIAPRCSLTKSTILSNNHFNISCSTCVNTCVVLSITGWDDGIFIQLFPMVIKMKIQVFFQLYTHCDCQLAWRLPSK